MTAPVERIAALAVGTVESVSPAEIRVILDVDAPQNIALNTGIPTGFPRVNGYVLIPGESGSIVGLVVYLGVERSPFPRRTGLKDFGLIDLPFPLRRLHVTPLGTLRIRTRAREGQHSYALERGVGSFPSVGDPVLMPTPGQLRAIVEAEGENRRVKIGNSPLAANAEVFVDPNKLFGRHLAVLGNTGSGKSCSVAGIVRWSLDAAAQSRKEQNASGPVNARFIVLDPNGEYLETFKDFAPRLFQVPPTMGGARPLRVPAWMWNSNEWTAFAQASPRVQRPLLLEGLRAIRSGVSLDDSMQFRLARVFGGWHSQFSALRDRGPDAYARFPRNNSAMEMLRLVVRATEVYEDRTPSELVKALRGVRDTCNGVIDDRTFYTTQNQARTKEFGEEHIEKPLASLKALLDELPADALRSSESEDSPVRFSLDAFPDFLESIAAREIGGNEQFIANLVWRIRSLLSDGRLRAVIGGDDAFDVDEWLAELIGTDGSTGSISVIDLSLVPAEIIHVVIAVVARLIFEAIQRYRRTNGVELPTVLVLEEAHTFVHRGRSEDDEGILTPAQMCRQTFEKIAREGRKFGLGLLLSSQRPFELSPTVLAQCNTFLLHRIVNDQDQELVTRLVPDNVRGILGELPSLPAGQAILLGWAATIPVLVQMNHLPLHHRPRSNDPDYWGVWNGTKPREVDWEQVVSEWLGGSRQST